MFHVSYEFLPFPPLSSSPSVKPDLRSCQLRLFPSGRPDLLQPPPPGQHFLFFPLAIFFRWVFLRLTRTYKDPLPSSESTVRRRPVTSSPPEAQPPPVQKYELYDVLNNPVEAVVSKPVPEKTTDVPPPPTPPLLSLIPNYWPSTLAVIRVSRRCRPQVTPVLIPTPGPDRRSP